MDFWRGCRVLITGMAGFVGANLARRLVDLGVDLVGLDLVQDTPSLRALGVADVRVLIRDVRERQRVVWAILHGDGGPNWRPPEVVIHLAGMSHIRDCQERPGEAWEANVQGTWAVLEACQVCPPGQIRAVVVAGSDTEYGSLNPGRTMNGELTVRQDAARTAFIETDGPANSGVYATSKSMASLLVRAYGAMGMPVAILRHANAGGPADPHLSHLIPGTIDRLLQGLPPLIRGNGQTIKGYLWVHDVCSAYLLIAEQLMAGRIGPGSPINAAPQHPISVRALVDCLIRIAGLTLHPEVLHSDPSQDDHVEHLSSDLLRSLGWTPDDSYAQWLTKTWCWYKEHPVWLALSG